MTDRETAPLKKAMTDKASAAKAAEGDAPVFAYIAGLPEPQRAIAERIDALAAETVPGLKRAVKWGMAYYGVEEGWCFSSGAFVGHVKLMFIRGDELEPEPPEKPGGMGKATRGVEPGSMAELDEAQVAAWMKQAVEKPYVSAAQRKKAQAQAAGGGGSCAPGQAEAALVAAPEPFVALPSR